MEGSPVRKSPIGHLHSQAKRIVYNTNRYFLEEKANRGPLLPPSKALERTAKACQISEKSVRNICSALNKAQDTDNDPEEPVSPLPSHRSGRFRQVFIEENSQGVS